MHIYIALLRGINVGGHNSLPMAELTKILERLGLENIRTYIQSGNVVFQNKNKLSKSFSEDISNAIENAKGFRPPLILLSVAELEAAIENNPFDTSSGKLLNFFFLQEQHKGADMEALEKIRFPSEEYKLTERVFYLFTPDGLAQSKVGRKIEKLLAVPVTARNWNTVKELQRMINE